MKNLITTAIMALSLTAFGAGVATASEDNKPLFTLPGVGYGAVDLGIAPQASDFDKRDDGTFYGVRYGRAFDWYRVDVGLSRLDADSDLAAVGGVGVTSLTLNGYADWKNTSKFEPYATAGLGLGRFSGTGVAKNDKGWNPVYNLGGGVRYWVTDDAALDVGYRHIWSDADVKSNSGTNSDFESDVITVGVNFAL